ncbi:hypothetical protein GCM10023068_43980 [Leifsonia shinshuensis]
MRFLLKVIINALALWLTTLIVSGVTVVPYAPGSTATVLTYLLVASSSAWSTRSSAR